MSDSNRPLVHLTLTLEQAAALSSALDAYVRLGLGQLEEIANLVRVGVIAPRVADGVGRRVASVEVCERVEALAHAMKFELGHPRNGSFGVGHPHVPLEGSRAYEVKKVLDQALAEHRDPSPKFRGVNYDGLLVRYTQDPEPVAVVREGAPAEAELPAEEWRELLKAVMREMAAKGQSKDGNAPGHSHTIPDIWDADNKPGLAGKPCAWCSLWNKATAALAKSERKS